MARLGEQVGGVWQSWAAVERCSGMAMQSRSVCSAVHELEPTLPIAPRFESTSQPCVTDGSGRTHCLPSLMVLPAWNALADNSPLTTTMSGLTTAGGCFGRWDVDAGAARWVRNQKSEPALHMCSPSLMWYPAFAARYLAAWNAAYDACKKTEIASLRANGKPESEYYGAHMWRTCRPRALAAHDATAGTGGTGAEATPPYVLRMLYQSQPELLRLLLVLRNPITRLEVSYWAHTQYLKRYGASAAGLDSYAIEQTNAFARCEAKHGLRRCAFLYEYLEREYADVFFHCDQVIRGLYAPFVQDWLGAFPNSTLTVRAEDFHDEPRKTQRRIWSFLRLPAGAVRSGWPRAQEKEPPQPMRNSTRALLERFYAPHNRRLATLLGDEAFLWGGPPVGE